MHKKSECNEGGVGNEGECDKDEHNKGKQLNKASATTVSNQGERDKGDCDETGDKARVSVTRVSATRASAIRASATRASGTRAIECNNGACNKGECDRGEHDKGEHNKQQG